MKLKSITLSLSLAGVCLCSVPLSHAGGVSDQDYFQEMPVVLSVTRLAQSVHDSPAAVTVLDRELIAKTGARSIAELLRLVPGFLVTYFDGAARPYATYHGDSDAFNRHLQVFVDGRSVYSGLLIGSATYGLLGVAIDEIERIEVIRGSNSASQGANAYLGVVNITTRHAADTVGGEVVAGSGEGGISDGGFRYGWGDDRAAFRLSVSNRRDNGFENRYDSSDRTSVNLRGDFNPTKRDEISLTGGFFGFDWGTNAGSANLYTGRAEERYRSSFAQARWRRQLDEGSELRAGFFADEERFLNVTAGSRVDGRVRRIGADVQHVFLPATDWRVLWGMEYRGEEINSPYLFATAPDQGNRSTRVFGNVEWRASERWLFNAGTLHERHSIVGGHIAPRYSANFMLTPGHSLRAGVTTAYKVPNQFESRTYWTGTAYRATGGARPERIDSREIGYLGEFRNIGLTVDVRGFLEISRSLLKFSANDIVNRDPIFQRGWESQLRWQFRPGTQIMMNYTELRMIPAAGTSDDYVYRVPRHFATLALFQDLPWDMRFSLIHAMSENVVYVTKATMIPAYSQTDIRLSKSFKWNGAPAELALNVLAVNGGHMEYSSNPAFGSMVDRRAFATLKVGF